MSDIETVKTTKARTRIQRLLSKIAGNDTPVKVKSKDEILLNEISENADGSGSSGGGANVLTLYQGLKGQIPNAIPWAYKDAEHSSEYETLEEARSALMNASIIKMYDATGFALPTTVFVSKEEAFVELIYKSFGEDIVSEFVYLYKTEDIT